MEDSTITILAIVGIISLGAFGLAIASGGMGDMVGPMDMMGNGPGHMGDIDHMDGDHECDETMDHEHSEECEEEHEDHDEMGCHDEHEDDVDEEEECEHGQHHP